MKYDCLISNENGKCLNDPIGMKTRRVWKDNAEMSEILGRYWCSVFGKGSRGAWRGLITIVTKDS